LRQILNEKEPNLANRLPEIESLAMSVLTYTAGSFPYFTSHDLKHSLEVERNLNWLIPDNVKLDLNAYEIFFLLIAAWLHDWGMISKQGEKSADIRRRHHERTEENFVKMYQSLKLNYHEARIIGLIARGHRVEDLRDSLYDKQIFSANFHIDVRFLAAILRLADECDITYNRVPELIYYSLNPVGASEEHFRAHLSIQGIGKWVPHKIEFFAVANDPKGSQTLHKLRDKIQGEVDHVKGILAERGILIEYVEVHIDSRGFIDKPIAFELDEKRITQLLIGEHLYARKDVAIRELLQNAVDACRLRRSLSNTSVEIRIYRQDGKLTVQDNGIGMDYGSAFAFLAHKGYSYYESEEFKKMATQVNFDPISR
jgi:signal transduction histidine kinase